MTEQQNPDPVEETEGTRRGPAEPKKFEVPEGAKDTGRYSAYDTRLGKYVGGVHDSKSKATDAAKAKGLSSGDFKVVEV